MFKYFYRLGHVPEIGFNEFLSTHPEAKLNSKYSVNYDYLLTNTQIEIEKMGSVVYGGTLLAELPEHKDVSLEVIRETFAACFPKDIKKIGFSAPSDLIPGSWIKLLKSAGSKKINTIEGEINIGHFKQTKTWLKVFRMDKKLMLGLIEHHFDQQLWRFVDETLLEGDMSRGLINLKLARSMMNLNPSQNIWDPFCGVGRNIVAGIDLKENFWASDIDPDCIAPTGANYSKAVDFFQKHFGDQSLGSLRENFSHDVVNSLDSVTSRLPTTANWGIVTEGFLGTNFQSLPTQAQVEAEYTKLLQLWSKFLDQLKQSQIATAVFCWPFYPKYLETSKQNLDKLLVLIAKSSFRNEQFLTLNSQLSDYIVYKRNTSFVAHAIFKINKIKL